MNRDSLKRKFLALVVALPLIWTSFIAFEASIAGIDSLLLASLVSSWNRKKLTVNEIDIDKALSVGKRALNHQSMNHSVLSSMADVYLHKSKNRYFWQPKRQDDMEMSLNYSMKAVKVMPFSSRDWSRIAVLKYKLGGIDDELFRALSVAYKFGPYEPVSAGRIVSIGMGIWEDMPDVNRIEFLNTVEIMLERNRKLVIQAAIRNNRLGILCDLLGDKKSLEKPCRKVNS